MVLTDIQSDLSIICAALYLRGAPRSSVLSPRTWISIESILRQAAVPLGSACRCLREAGLPEIAIALEERRLLTWAERQVRTGRVLTTVDDAYPGRWQSASGLVPPAVWCVGPIPRGPSIGIVGTRSPTSPQIELSRTQAQLASKGGRFVLSGGARGIDREAQCAASEALVILPYGIDHYDGSRSALSLCAPWEPFSTGLAMQRNAAIYLAAEQTVAIGARLRQGGTWHGALDALRRRLGKVIVPNDGSPAAAALLALGARPLVDQLP
jgi:predicted Rossmann fold nucleotide-binding protein DprA/Smf involved in DNA uptake